MAVVVQVTPGGQGPFDIHLLSPDGEEHTSRPLFHSPASEGQPDLSPDGRWIAYRSDESGRDEVYVQRFPELGGRIKISTDGGTSPRWSADGAELYYRNGSAMMAVTVGNADASLDVGLPGLLFDGPYLNDSGRNYEIAPDGHFPHGQARGRCQPDAGARGRQLVRGVAGRAPAPVARLGSRSRAGSRR